MPMPHRIQLQLIKHRLVGKEGSERVRELRAALDELPGYRNGPYADLRKWVEQQIDETRVRASVVHRDSISVRREGAAQVGLVGPPNAGKSSLLHALSDVQIKIGDYAFTTLRPVPAVTRLNGVLIQLVEIPGLIEGAAGDRGGGRALLGVLRDADAILFCHAAGTSPHQLSVVRREVSLAGIDLPAGLAVTKVDDADERSLEEAAAAFPDLPAVGVSVLDDDSLARLRDHLWGLTGLMRVFLQRAGEIEEAPVALPIGARVIDVARAIHNDVARECRGALVTGPSARFPRQRVGRDHMLADGDVVEVLR